MFSFVYKIYSYISTCVYMHIHGNKYNLVLDGLSKLRFLKQMVRVSRLQARSLSVGDSTRSNWANWCFRDGQKLAMGSERFVDFDKNE